MWRGHSFVKKFLVLTILSMMGEVVDEVVVLKCLGSILDVLIEEVAKEEILLRPPGEGDAGQDVRWVNHFGEVETFHVRANVEAKQDAFDSKLRLVSLLVRDCDLVEYFS